MNTIRTSDESRNTRHVAGVTFFCAACGATKPVQTNGGTGYACRDDGALICYACCAITDRENILRDGKACLYLTKTDAKHWEVINWPGTLRFAAYHVAPMRHPWARQARIAYFTGPDGKRWYAKNIGDSQIAHCRRLKSAT